MTFHNGTYKITMYKVWLEGNYYRPGPVYRVYKPCGKRTDGKGYIFGNTLTPGEKPFYSVKDAIAAMNNHRKSEVNP